MRVVRLIVAPLLLIAAIVYNGSGGGETNVRYERASASFPTPWAAPVGQSVEAMRYWMAVGRWSEAQDRAAWFAEAERQAAQREAERTRRPQSAPRPYRASVTASGFDSSGTRRACVANSENGGSYGRSSNPSHFGRYQFSRATWASYGGDPGTWGNASPEEQDAVFNRAWKSPGGPSNWTPYDGC